MAWRRGVVSLLFLLVLASSVSAERAYVSAREPRTCTNADSSFTFSCPREVVHIIDTDLNRAVGRLDLWDDVIYISDIAVNSDGTRLAVAGARSFSGQVGPSELGFLDVIDVQSGTRLVRFTTPIVWDGGVHRSRVDYHPDGSRLLWATSTTTLRVVDTSTNTIVATPRVPYWMANVVSAPDGARLYVAHVLAPALTVVDARSYSVVAELPLPEPAEELAISPDGTRLYAALRPWGSTALHGIVEIATATNTVAGTVTGSELVDRGGVFRALTFAGNARAYATVLPHGGGPAGVLAIDVSTRSVDAFVPFDSPRRVLAFGGGHRLLLTEGRALKTLSTTSHAVIASVSVPEPVDVIAIGPGRREAHLQIDTPRSGATVTQPFAFGGWTIDFDSALPGPGVDAVHVWAFPHGGGAPVFVGAPAYFQPRSDVGALFGSSYTAAGFHMAVAGLRPGPYDLRVFARSTRTGEFTTSRAVTVTVQSSARLVVDTPADGGAVHQPFLLGGWAIDGAAPSGAGIDAVHVWAYPSDGGAPLFAGAATLGVPRPDVAALFGTRFGTAGYHLTVSTLPPGGYLLVVYGRDSTGAFAAQQALNVTVLPPERLMVLDIPSVGLRVTGPVRVAGWAISRGATAGTGIDAVHVWAYPVGGGQPIFVGSSYGAQRDDVADFFGPQYRFSGFDLVGTLPSGEFDLVAFARVVDTQGFDLVRVVRIAVE